MTTSDTRDQAPRVTRMATRAGDRYKVTVGDVLIGRVRRAPLATAKIGGAALWYATPVGKAEQAIPYSTRRDAVAALVDAAQAPAQPADEPEGDPRDAGYLVRSGRGGLIDIKVRVECGYCPAGSRDTECKIHGLVADRSWWRTPAHLREDGPDMPDEPRMTWAEAQRDAIALGEIGGRYRW